MDSNNATKFKLNIISFSQSVEKAFTGIINEMDVLINRVQNDTEVLENLAL